MDSHEVRRGWAERSGEYSPDYYAYYGPDETSESVRSVVDRHLDRDAAILEVGCSSGRHLAHLHEHGYEDLSGIEVNADAFDVMGQTYPDLAETGTFYHDTVEAVVDEFQDDRFDAVYSVETLQHLHPDAEWVYDELARITADLLITVENERGVDSVRAPGDPDPGDPDDGELADSGDASDSGVCYVNDEFPLYYRDWGRIFRARGLDEVAATSDERSTVHEHDTVRVFRTPE